MVSPTLVRKSEAGWSLLELVVVAGIFMVGTAVAIPASMRMVRDSKADSGVVMTQAFLQSARNRAVAERRNIVLVFPSDNSMRLERIEVPSNLRTVIDTLTLEGEQKFRREGQPDTPDRFGGANEINFTGVQPVMFTSDGSLIDSAGDVANGTIYIQREDMAHNARAVTISGVTGLTRTWKWAGGTQWVQ